MTEPISNYQPPIEPPITPSQSVPAITPPPTPQKSPMLSIILGLVIVILLGGMGYFAYQYFMLKNQLAIAPTPTPSPTIETADPTANWKTYTISQLGLTLKLPPDLEKLGSWKTDIVPGDTGSNVCFHVPITQSFLIKPVYAGGVGLCNGSQKFIVNAVSSNFTAGRGPGFTDISGYKESQGKYYSSDKTTPIDSSLVQKETNSNNVTYLRILGKNTEDDNWPSPGTPGKGYIAAIINTQNSEYPGINIIMQLDDQLTLELFDQILSTFKFTDKTSSTSTILLKPTIKETTPSPSPKANSNIPSGWTPRPFPTVGLILYAPKDWKSSIQEFPEYSSNLIRFWQGETQDTSTVQLDISNNWDNKSIGYQYTTFTISDGIEVKQADPPKMEERKLDRYQTNFAFEKNGKVYYLNCVHNWIETNYSMCISLLKSMEFTSTKSE